MWNEHFICEVINFPMWIFQFMCGIHVSNSNILQVKFWTNLFYKWISYVICENVPIPHVKWKFHMWKCSHFICEMKISYVKTFPFHMWNENFVCENVPISYVKWTFHMWKRSQSTCEMKISYEKMFQFHMFFTCEMIFEIFGGTATVPCCWFTVVNTHVILQLFFFLSDFSFRFCFFLYTYIIRKLLLCSHNWSNIYKKSFPCCSFKLHRKSIFHEKSFPFNRKIFNRTTIYNASRHHSTDVDIRVWRAGKRELVSRAMPKCMLVSKLTKHFPDCLIERLYT